MAAHARVRPCCWYSLETLMAGTSPAITSIVERTIDSALHAHRDTHAAADAQRREPPLGVALLHLEQQGGEHARAGRADRMADRDRAAVDVDLGGIPTEVLVDRAGLRGKCLVRLDQVEIVD